MAIPFMKSARRVGMAAGFGSGLLSAVYAVTLTAGLLSLKSREEPIGEPYFSILEMLILLLMPLLVGLMVAVHACAPEGVKVFSLLSLVFMAVTAGLTCSVHFLLLTVGRRAEFAGVAGMPLILSFRWPSVAYALDILAWDGFFPLAVLCAAPVFSGSRLALSIRGLLIASGVLALAGLSGVIAGDMRLRNIGIGGYLGVFPVAAVLMAVFFKRQLPAAVLRTRINA